MPLLTYSQTFFARELHGQRQPKNESFGLFENTQIQIYQHKIEDELCESVFKSKLKQLIALNYLDATLLEQIDTYREQISQAYQTFLDALPLKKTDPLFISLKLIPVACLCPDLSFAYRDEQLKPLGLHTVPESPNPNPEKCEENTQKYLISLNSALRLVKTAPPMRRQIRIGEFIDQTDDVVEVERAYYFDAVKVLVEYNRFDFILKHPACGRLYVYVIRIAKTLCEHGIDFDSAWVYITSTYHLIDLSSFHAHYRNQVDLAHLWRFIDLYAKCMEDIPKEMRRDLSLEHLNNHITEYNEITRKGFFNPLDEEDMRIIFSHAQPELAFDILSQIASIFSSENNPAEIPCLYSKAYLLSQPDLEAILDILLGLSKPMSEHIEGEEESQEDVEEDDWSEEEHNLDISLTPERCNTLLEEYFTSICLSSLCL